MRRWSTVGALAILVALMAYLPVFSPNFTASVPGADYLVFFVGAKLYREGEAARLYDIDFHVGFQHDPRIMGFTPDPNLHLPYVYPPFFVWFCLPFSYLPFKAGAIAWMWTMAVALVAAVWLLARTEKIPKDFGLLLFISLILAPTVESLYTCQNSTLSLLLFVGTYALLRGGRPVAAGVVFALLAFKPQMTLVFGLVMLLRGQWRFIAGVLGGGLGLIAASLAISPTSIQDYLALREVLARWIDFPGMHEFLPRMACWMGFWRMLMPAAPLDHVRVIAAASSLVTLGILATFFRGRFDVTGPRFPRQYSAVILATILTSPHLLHYDLCLLLIPMTLVVLEPAADRMRWFRLTEVLFLIAVVSPYVAPMLGFSPAVLAMFAYLAALAMRPRIAEDYREPENTERELFGFLRSPATPTAGTPAVAT